MNPRIIYPIPKQQALFYKNFRSIMRIIFIVAVIACVLVNIVTKGKPWSIIVCWSLYMTWQLAFSLKLVEFSLFSHIVKGLLYTVILLGLIDYFIAPGWAQTVIPIVLFGLFLIMAILYFAIYSKKDRHLVSILILGIFNILAIPYSFHSWPITNWLSFSFTLASIVLFIVMIIISYKDIIYELKSRFRR